MITEELKKQISEAISHTGFPLEHYICNVLKKHQWNIISNRYYIDDVKGTEREIDIIAYKVSDSIDDVQYITTLVISCKKSEENRWCFLTRAVDTTDGNINWSPLHFCSTDKRFKFILETQNSLLVYKYLNHKALSHLYTFSNQVFAFQILQKSKKEKDKNRGALCIKENTDMYNSIITTIKAISSEKKSRFERYNNQSKRCYLFYALSIFDGGIIESKFENDGSQTIDSVSDIKYLNRHIVNNVDDFYIVDFTTKDNFDYRLKLYDILHSANTKYLSEFLNEFYENIFQFPDRINILWKDFEDSIRFGVRYHVEKLLNVGIDANKYKIWHSYYADIQTLTLDIGGNNSLSIEQWEILNNNEELKQTIKTGLLKFFKYNGNFIFGETLPF